jgi:hypothetical protein
MKGGKQMRRLMLGIAVRTKMARKDRLTSAYYYYGP